MHRIFLFFLIAFSTLSILKEQPPKEPIPELLQPITASNLSKLRNSGPLLMMVYYKSSAKQSEASRRVMETLARKESVGGMRVAFGQLEANQEQAIAQRLKALVNGSILLILYDREIHYEGELSEGKIGFWVKKKIGLSAERIDSEAQHLDFVQDEESLIYLFPEGDVSAKESFIKASRELDSRCAYSEAKVIKSKEKITSKYALVHRSKRLGRRVTMRESPFSLVEFVRFEAWKRSLSVLELDKAAFDRVLKSEKPAVLLFGEHDERWFNLSAEKEKERLLFLRARPGEETTKKMAELLGLEGGGRTQAVRIIRYKNDHFQRFACRSEEEPFRICLDDFKKERLVALLKSQSVPIENKGRLRVIVGSTFQREVMSSPQSVLFLIYAPLSDRGGKIEGNLAKVAEKFSKNELIVAKMDGTANEVPGLDLRVLPVMRLFKKGEKRKPSEYKGDWSEDSLVDFVAKSLGVAKDGEL